MTVQQIYDYVGSLVDDKDFGYFTTTELLRYINQKAREVQKELVLAGNNWYVQIDESQTTTINQANYTLPTDFLKMNRIELVQNPGTNEQRYPLVSITLNQKDRLYLEADTSCYYLLKNTLYLNPMPKTVKTIRMYYTYRIAECTSSSDTPDVPAEYQEYLANLVVMKCFLKDGRDPGFILNEVEMVRKALAASAIERAQDHASTVVVMDDDSMVY